MIALIRDLTLMILGLGHFKRECLQIRHFRNLLTARLTQMLTGDLRQISHIFKHAIIINDFDIRALRNNLVR